MWLLSNFNKILFFLRCSFGVMTTYEHWDTLQELIGPRELWPSDVRGYMWRMISRETDFLNDAERFRLALFTYVNDVPLAMFITWCQTLHLFGNTAGGIEHVTRLYNTFKDDQVKGRNRYSSWNVRLGVDMYVTGKIHYYPQKRE